MTKPMANLGFTFVLILILVAALLLAREWPAETALFPRAVGLLMLSRAHAAEPDDMTTNQIDPTQLAGAATMFAWLIGFGVGIWVLGFYASAFCFVFFFVRVRAQDPIVTSLGWASAITAVVYLLFTVIIQQPPYDGLILEWLAG